ncbi:MAG: 4Fe-4S binding protein [Deltaproteobacteria bacterium]|nr:4Fe-4S binding protein [Deltaproteobacteria bacterium]
MAAPDGKRFLLGNEALARGLLENGCLYAASYPGTPASEILSAFIQMAEAARSPARGEWSINEKVAFETALAVGYCGGRSAVSMKQVGLNVACDPLMSSAYTGVKGGFLVISADDPGPNSSQTEQDSRMMALMAKIPVLDPSTPREAKEMVGLAYALSEEFEIPVMIRPTTRICHSRQGLALGEIPPPPLPSGFSKDPQRWAATPKFRHHLHRKLNQKIALVAARYGREGLSRIFGQDSVPRCILSSGAALSHLYDLVVELGWDDRVALFQVKMPFPLDAAAVLEEIDRFTDILVVEETSPVIEMQLARRGRIRGRLDGAVPAQGELLPGVLLEVLQSFAGLSAEPAAPRPGKSRRPTLCPGCGHRAAFFAVRRALPQGIYPGDIGCYSLGLNLKAVDTILCMGAAISQAAGFYHAYRLKGEFPSIAATIGDSTFYHAGIPPLINAVHTGARFILLILDNSTTAMTGNQPTPAAAGGQGGQAVAIEDLVRASGVKNLWIVDPYDLSTMEGLLQEADRLIRSPKGGICVIIARHPCLLDRAGRSQKVQRLEIDESCVQCGICHEDFECPALGPDPQAGRARIDPTLCSGCAVCVQVCPAGAIKAT